MDVSHILENLNDPQRDAVTSEDQSLLVLAGAGSGKTRVLVHRIAWSVEAMGLNPSSIMAVTFTNKAAQEMQSRIQELLQSPVGDMWCGTFHGLAHRTLKRFYKDAGLISGFTILDSDDQLRIVKRLIKEAGLDDGAWPPKQMQWQINSCKVEGIRADKVNDNGEGISEENMPRLFQRFFRVDESRSRSQGGSGLGLAIVKHIIDAHNENIYVQSTVGVGSEFSFSLKKSKVL